MRAEFVAGVSVFVIALLTIAGFPVNGNEGFLGKYSALPETRVNTTQLGAVFGRETPIDLEVTTEFYKKGEEYFHRWSVPAMNYEQDLPIKFGEEQSGNFNGTSFKYKYTREGNNIIRSYFEVAEPWNLKTINEYVFTLEGLEKTHRVPSKNVTAEVSFRLHKQEKPKQDAP